MKGSNNVIAWSMRNFRITFLLVGCLFVFGIYGLVRIPKQEFPEYTIRQGGRRAAGRTAGAVPDDL